MRRIIPSGDNICLFCLGCLNNPVVLRCYHRLCKSCVQSYWEITQSLKCPVCLRETLCKVSLQNVSSEISGSNSGNLILGNTESKMVSLCLSRLSFNSLQRILKDKHKTCLLLRCLVNVM